MTAEGRGPIGVVDDVRRKRSVEEAALAIVIERLPTKTTGSRLLDLMNEDAAPTPARVAAIELAVEGLVAVGLLVREGAVLGPTRAARRSAELDLGL
jgi:hypothetical protein